MSDGVVIQDRLRRLAIAAAPTVSAAPRLATVALARARSRRRRRQFLAIGGGVVAIAGSVVAARGGHAGPYRNVIEPSGSMSPTIAIGESVIVDTRLTPRRGDVVLVRVHRDGITFESIKRVEALPGDTISCPATSHGTCSALTRNGTPVTEPFVRGSMGQPFSDVTVPAGSMFVLGDNRDASADSRIWGPLPIAAVEGVVVRVVSAGGKERAVPGAPHHPGPGKGGSVDPQEPPPPAQQSTPK
jgi:signal peptidase I